MLITLGPEVFARVCEGPSRYQLNPTSVAAARGEAARHAIARNAGFLGSALVSPTPEKGSLTFRSGVDFSEEPQQRRSDERRHAATRHRHDRRVHTQQVAFGRQRLVDCFHK